MGRRPSSGGAGRTAGALLLVAFTVGLLGSADGLAAEGPGRKAVGRRPAAASGGAASVAPPASSGAPASSGSAGGGARRGRGGKLLRGVANLNQADQAVLELLPGIGEVMASRIVEYRKNHPFRKVDDLSKVKGIGRKKLAKLRPFLSVAGPSTLAEEDGAAPAPADDGGEEARASP